VQEIGLGKDIDVQGSIGERSKRCVGMHGGAQSQKHEFVHL